MSGYTDDKKALQEAVAESDGRLSATQLITGKSRVAVDLSDTRVRRARRARFAIGK